MFERRRLHPLAIVFFVFGFLKDVSLPLAVFFVTQVFRGDGLPLYWIISGVVLITLLAIGWGVVAWLRQIYFVENDVLHVEKGVLFQKKQYIAKQRIQTVDVTEGIIHRWFGVVKLQVQTAGGQAPEAILSAISREDAQTLRSMLTDEALESEVSEKGAHSDAIENNSAIQRRELSFKRLMFMAATSGSIGVILTVLAAASSQVSQFLGDDSFFYVILQWLLGIAIVVIVLVVVFSAWLIAIATTVLKYYQFTIVRKDQRLHIMRGLLEKREVSIPLSRIQAIRIVESPLRQPFGFVSVYVESIGYGQGKGESTLLFPLLKRTEVETFLADFVPSFGVHEDLHTLPRRALRKYMVFHVLPVLLVSITVPWFMPWNWSWLLLLLIPLAGLFAYWRWREAGWYWLENKQLLVLRERLLVKTTALVPYNRVQSCTLSQSPFQRKAGLSTFQVKVATSQAGGANYRLWHTEAESGRVIMGLLKRG